VRWGLSLAALLLAACPKPPPECNEETLSRAARAEAASNKIYARSAVLKALDATTKAREALDKKDYASAKTLCKDALDLAVLAENTVDQAKKRQNDVGPMYAAAKAALDETTLSITAGRSLLDVVPHAELDEKLRNALAQHATVLAQANAAKALIEGSGYGEELTALNAARDAALKLKSETDAIVVDIRKNATAKCKPKEKRPLFFGARARSHDGFALIESGESEDAPSGFVSVVKTGESGGCRPISSRKIDDAGALPNATDPSIALSTWNMGGVVPVRLLFAWNGREAWFFGDTGRWYFDSAKVAGFKDACLSVACTSPDVKGDHVDVKCTCDPKPGVENLELARDVRFSWHGHTVLAEQ
jgi:hypothetical protein